MNKKQLKLLRYIYKSPKERAAVFKQFNVNHDNFSDELYNKEMQQYFEVLTFDNKWDILVKIKPNGKAVVETARKYKLEWFHHWITLGIAVTAFIKSFFF